MSLHYLLDGYNILKQIPAFRDLPLEEGRRGLLGWIDRARPQGSLNNQVTVVFDGHPDHFGGSSQGDIRVIFSDGCSADDQIKRMVEEDADKKNCVVVSNDKEVYLYARSLGTRVMSVEVFTSKPKGLHGPQEPGGKYIACSKGKYRARNPGSSNSREKEAGLSLSSQEKINKELKDIWLKEK